MPLEPQKWCHDDDYRNVDSRLRTFPVTSGARSTRSGWLDLFRFETEDDQVVAMAQVCPP